MRQIKKIKEQLKKIEKNGYKKKYITVVCTIQEKEKIKSLAKKRRQSMNQYMLYRALKE